MGVCINYKFKTPLDTVEKTLDAAEATAREMKKAAALAGVAPFEVKREGPRALRIDIGNCETLAFRFQTPAELAAERAGGWTYAGRAFDEIGGTPEGYMVEEFPRNRLAYASGFCKTQYSAKLIEHKFIAELCRAVASRCELANVYDEGDYYCSGDIEDAARAIHGNAAVIAAVGGMLAGLGYEVATPGAADKVRKPRAKKR